MGVHDASESDVVETLNRVEGLLSATDDPEEEAAHLRAMRNPAYATVSQVLEVKLRDFGAQFNTLVGPLVAITVGKVVQQQVWGQGSAANWRNKGGNRSQGSHNERSTLLYHQFCVLHSHMLDTRAL